MSDEISSKTKPALKSGAPDPFETMPNNAAVQRCASVWIRTFTQETAEGTDRPSAYKMANRSYRLVMPALVERSDIRDFIACTTYGVLMGAIDAKESSKLLYAAQVALAALRPHPESD